MRKIVWGLAAIIVASLIVVACQKDAGSPTAANAPFDAKAAKEWYYGTYKKTAEWASYKAQTSGKRLPGWDKGIERKIGKLNIVEFPFVKEKNSFMIVSRGELQPESKRKIAEAAFSRVLFIKYPSGAIQVREMQYIPDMDYMARHQYDASSNSLGDIDADFSGTIVAKKWNGEEVSRKILKNGKITASFKTGFIKRASLTESCPIGTTQVNEYERECESHLYGDGMLTYQCGAWYATGNQWCIGEDEINANPDCTNPNTAECSCSLTGSCDDPGGGSEDPLPEINNNVDDPCIRASVNDAINGGCKNKITSFINNTYANSDQFHLQFNDNVVLANGSGDDAYTVCNIIPNTDDVLTNITFNNTEMANASKEYIAATILHEALHAWIDYKFPNPVEAAQQHQMMASSNRFDIMRDALLEMYPNLSHQDATDLTWGGLFNTVQFMTLPAAEQARIVQKNLDYKNHTLGTPC